jgi:hypothetical protein
MPNFTAVSYDQHGQRRWKYPQNLSFASAQTTVPIIGSELAAVVPSTPLAFNRTGDRFSLIALLSLVPGQNLFIGPAGNWLAGYVPVTIRSYPFRLIKPEGAKDPILCIDETQGIVPEGQEGNKFFEDDGTISAELQKALDLQVMMEQSRVRTDAAVASLASADIIVPWHLIVKTENGDRVVDDLYRIDENLMGQLPSDAFSQLRNDGALAIAYGQLFSAHQMGVFERLKRLQADLAPKSILPMSGSLDHLFDHSEHLELNFD